MSTTLSGQEILRAWQDVVNERLQKNISFASSINGTLSERLAAIEAKLDRAFEHEHMWTRHVLWAFVGAAVAFSVYLIYQSFTRQCVAFEQAVASEKKDRA